MSKLSERIRKQAKKYRQRDKSKKLTEHQNNLAKSYGYNNFKHLVTQERASDIEERTQFAKSGLSKSIDSVLPKDISVFVRADGRRGLKALAEFKSGEIIFREPAILWFNLQEDSLGIGLSWGLTRNIATKFPQALSVMRDGLKLRESFQPKLRSSDKKILAVISRESGLPESTVKSIYNLVCTYNVIAEVRGIYGKYVILGARISISPGLAYANHSCEPNCTRIQPDSVEDFKSSQEGLRAIQDIQSDEELTWSYFNGPIPASLKDRQKTLRREFGFYCDCNRCRRERPKL